MDPVIDLSEQVSPNESGGESGPVYARTIRNDHLANRCYQFGTPRAARYYYEEMQKPPHVRGVDMVELIDQPADGEHVVRVP